MPYLYRFLIYNSYVKQLREPSGKFSKITTLHPNLPVYYINLVNLFKNIEKKLILQKKNPSRAFLELYRTTNLFSRNYPKEINHNEIKVNFYCKFRNNK